MEYIYAAMLLHKAGKPIDEDSVTKVLKAVGIEAGTARVKALVAALSEVDIEEAIKQTAVAATAAPAAAAPSEEGASEEKKEEKKEEDQGKKAEEAAAGLSSLFG